MGKRSDFPRKPRDFYPTPFNAVEPLIPHLQRLSTFVEPMAGNGALIDALENLTGMKCIWKSDIEPQRKDIKQVDAFDLTLSDYTMACDVIITNPPWSRDFLHRAIMLFSMIRPTWLLLDADWMHTKQSVPYIQYLHKVQPVGRVKWIADSRHTSKDNVAWHLFSGQPKQDPEKFKFYSRGYHASDNNR